MSKYIEYWYPTRYLQFLPSSSKDRLAMPVADDLMQPKYGALHEAAFSKMLL